MALGDMFSRLKEGLARTRRNMVEKIQSVVLGYTQIDDEMYEDLEAVLIQADLGVSTTMDVLDALRERIREDRINDPEQIPGVLQTLLTERLPTEIGTINLPGPLSVVVVVGVNGVGKTTTIGKLAHRLHQEGRRVVLAAADTFRAAAGEQLEIWAQRTASDIIRQEPGSDPAAVAFDSIQAARARNADVVIIDTAGRLHTKSNLMEELKKIARVVAREVPGAPHEVLLVVDATTGQNAVQQARTFGQAVGVTGLILTKLDGTAKGGIIFAISAELALPVKFIGIGEGVDDLRPFDPDEFVTALFSQE